ncbi:putative Chemotaxis protein CheY [Gammaproteobacteria bacterium]
MLTTKYSSEFHSYMNGLRILVIDDASAIRVFIRVGLSEIFKHIEILESPNGRHAQTILNSKPVDLVLCDWEMPEINGHKLLVWIRENERLKHIPFIMITGSADKKNVLAALQAGIDGYVVKPFSVDVLIKQIQETMLRKNAATLKNPVTE